MQELKIAKIITLEKDMASVMAQNTKENLSAFLRRMDVTVEDSWDKDVLALILRDTIVENPEYVLYIYGKEILTFLIRLWESDRMELNPSDFSLLGQLKLLGFLEYESSIPDEKGVQQIKIIKEARDHFYFYMKSKSARRFMDKFENWESVIRGMMTYYGIISFNRFYIYFCKCIQEPVDDELFHLFLSVRINLLPFGSFVMETSSSTEYYHNYEATNPEQILEACMKNKKTEYILPKYETLFLLGSNNGLGDWDGMSDVADILMNECEVEYYRTIVIIKSTILMIQNGETFENIMNQFFIWCPQALNRDTEMKKHLTRLYETVPVYSLKGWARKDQKVQTNSSPVFTVIRGGKKENRKGGNRI